MVQTISTRYLGPTNHRGSRVVPWDYGKDTGPNHERAALALAEKLQWGSKKMVKGETKNGYVFIPRF